MFRTVIIFVESTVIFDHIDFGNRFGFIRADQPKSRPGSRAGGQDRFRLNIPLALREAAMRRAVMIYRTDQSGMPFPGFVLVSRN